MKNLSLIPLILFVYSSLYGSRNNLSRELSILPHCDIGKTTAFPSIYQNDLSHKIYFLFSTNLKKEIRQLSGVMIQFYKKFVYNEHLPKDILFQIFDYLTPSLSTFFFLNLGHIKEKVDLYPIWEKDINAGFLPHLASDDSLKTKLLNILNPLKRFSFENNDPVNLLFEDKDISQNNINLLGEAGLILFSDHLKEYQICRSFNNQKDSAYFHNKLADLERRSKFYFGLGVVPGTSRLATKRINSKNTVTIVNRNNDKPLITIEFDDYILGAFCSNKSLFVELIDEVLEFSGLSNQRKHNETSKPPKNHRVEIYDLKTREKKAVLSFPLVIPYQFNTFLYSLVYVDADNIYLYDLMRAQHISLPYKNSSVREFMNQSAF